MTIALVWLICVYAALGIAFLAADWRMSRRQATDTAERDRRRDAEKAEQDRLLRRRLELECRHLELLIERDGCRKQ